MKQHRSSFSLGSLFLLVACIALVLAAARSAVAHWENRDVGLAWVAAGAILGAVVGLFMGFGARRWVRGGFSGFFIGAIAGGMAGAQLGGPPEMLVVIMGVVMLILLSAVLRPRTAAEDFESQGPASNALQTAEGPRDPTES